MNTWSVRPIRRFAALAILLCAAPAWAQFAVGAPRAEGPILPPPGPTPTVQSLPFGPQDIIPGPGNDDRPDLHPNHPPIDQVPPMPMAQGGVYNPVASDSVIVHDSQANQTWELPLVHTPNAGNAQGPGYNGADGFVVPPE